LKKDSFTDNDGSQETNDCWFYANLYKIQLTNAVCQQDDQILEISKLDSDIYRDYSFVPCIQSEEDAKGEGINCASDEEVQSYFYLKISEGSG
jgi:hypothetical protein